MKNNLLKTIATATLLSMFSVTGTLANVVDYPTTFNNAVVMVANIDDPQHQEKLIKEYENLDIETKKSLGYLAIDVCVSGVKQPGLDPNVAATKVLQEFTQPYPELSDVNKDIVFMIVRYGYAMGLEISKQLGITDQQQAIAACVENLFK